MITRRGAERKGEPVPVDDWERPDPLCLLRPILRVTLVEWLVILAIIAVLVALLTPAPSMARHHKYPPPRLSPRNAARCAGEFCGGFARHYIHGISILPDGRYSYRAAGGQEAGEARSIGGMLMLTPSRESEVLSRRPHVFVPVPWGRRTYLIPPEKMRNFCDAIIAGEEPRTDPQGNYYASNLLAQVHGKPALPREWVSYLDKHLLSGSVIEVIDHFTVRLDLGSDQSVRVNKILSVPGPPRWNRQRLRVMEVDRSSCVARSGDHEASDKPLTIGRTVVGRRNTESPTLSRESRSAP